MKQSKKVASYHNNLLKGLKTILAVVGKKSFRELCKDDLQFIDKNGFVHNDVNRYYKDKMRD
jgi:glutamate synthase domain-containing protein 2